jgi:hypothetical protein
LCHQLPRYVLFQPLTATEKAGETHRTKLPGSKGAARTAFLLPNTRRTLRPNRRIPVSDLTTDGAGVSRREFTLHSALALLSTCVITIDGCGGGSSPSPTPTPTPTTGDVTGSISGNHGHTAVITGAMITAGSAVSLDIRGNADHPHTVEVSQTDLATLKNRQAVSKQSTNNSGHAHSVTFTPA